MATSFEALKKAIETSSEFSRKGRHRQALDMLEDLIAEAKYENHTIRVQGLSRHAAIIADAMGDLALVQRYCEQVISYAPSDAVGLYALADILLRRGEADSARPYAVKSYEICLERNSKEDRSLVELILRRWREIGLR